MADIPTIIPNLKEISTSTIAVALWNHVDIAHATWRRYKDPDVWGSLPLEVLKLADKLSLPNSELKLVQQYVRQVLSEMDYWVGYHHIKIFFMRGSNYDLYCHLSKFVWYPNGTIDFKKTALNLQSSVRLNDVEKFRFLCVYCLKDEIERRWPLFENKVFDCVEFTESPLIYYWNCHCKNELDKISLLEDLTIDITMFRHGKVDNWSAREYFFDRMNAEEQIENTIWIINEVADACYQKLLLNKLTHCQRTQIYSNDAVEIFYNYGLNSIYSSDILTTWLDVKDLINEEQFVSIISGLINGNSIDESIVTEIWISASDAFKHRLLNDNSEVLVNKIWQYWKKMYDNDSFVMLMNASANIRSEIRSKKIFDDHCSSLLCADKLSMLERVLSLCFPKDEELKAFKLNLTRKESFVKRCRQLIIDDELSKLERLLNLCFCDMDNLARFWEDRTAEEILVQHCFCLLYKSELSIFQRLSNLCFPTMEKLARFRENLVKHDYFKFLMMKMIFEKNLLSLRIMLDLFFPQAEQLTRFTRDLVDEKFFTDHCFCLMIRYDTLTLEKLFDCVFVKLEESNRFKSRLTKNEMFDGYCFLLLYKHKLFELEVLSNFMFTDVEERASFRRKLTKTEYFQPLCQFWIRLAKLEELNELLNWSFPNARELIEFRRNLAGSSKVLKELCSLYYTTANFEGLNDSLKFFFSARNDLMIEYKQNFLLSEDGFKACMFLCKRPGNSLDEIMVDCLPRATRYTTNEFKKKIIFSPANIAKLKKEIRQNRLNKVKNCFDKFLVNEEDVRRLKSLIFANLDELIIVIFSNPKYDQNTFESLISWWLQDEPMVKEHCVRQISVDKIFQEMLKKCLFKTYDSDHFAYCILKKYFQFDTLDRFLKWYFESPKQIKEYKIRMVDKYRDLEVIGALLKKCSHRLYWRQLADWFFENDHVEIAKFRKKHDGDDIARIVKFVRESYFKQR